MCSLGSLLALVAPLWVLLAASQPGISADNSMWAPPEASQSNGTLYAACRLRPSALLAEDLPRVYGHVLFKQDFPDGRLAVLVWISGLPKDDPLQARALHIHQYGDLSRGCDATGGHYNPHGVDHPKHPGDFGNFLAQDGKISATLESEATLFGELSAMGRAVVLHEGKDDLGLGGDAASLQNGNAGRRLACCVIGIATPALWGQYEQQ